MENKKFPLLLTTSCVPGEFHSMSEYHEIEQEVLNKGQKEIFIVSKTVASPFKR